MRAPVGLLLAAGFGKRFDPSGALNKLAQPLSSGTPVAVQAAQNLCSVLSQVIVVVHDQKFAEQIDFSGSSAVQILLCPHADLGMGATLAFAASELVRLSPEADSVIIALADMPFVQAETIRIVADAMQSGADIAQPVYQQKTGHPVGFAKRHFPALMALSGDKGARDLLLQFPVTRLDVQDPGILLDIDYPEDLKRR